MGVTRTYVRGLVTIVHTLCVYIVRYDTTIRKYLPTDALAAYEVMRDGCEGFLEAVGTLSVNP